MSEKGCIFDIIAWRGARRWLHWRLLRLLLQRQQEQRVQAACGRASVADGATCAATLRRWFSEERPEHESHMWEHDNEAVCKWLQHQAADDNSLLERNLRAIRQDAVLHTVNELIAELTPSQRAEFVRKLSALELE